MRIRTPIPNAPRGLTPESLDTLPARLEHRPSRGNGIIMIVFGAIWAAFMGVIAIGAAEETPVGWAVLLFSLFGLWLITAGLRLLRQRQTIALYSDRVEVEERDVLGSRHWREDLSAFQGLLSEIDYRSTGSGNSRRTYAIHTLKLQHRDPQRTLLLFETPQEEGHRTRWETIARHLQLPALEKDGDQVIARDPQDLDKNIADLVAEGKVQVDETSLAQPPPELQMRELDGELRLDYKMPVKVVPYVIFAAIPLAFIVFSLGTGHLPLPFAIFGAAFLAITLLLLLVTCLTEVRLVIRDGRLYNQNLVLGKRLLNEELDLSGVESIRIGTLGQETAEGVVLKGDTGSLQVGTYLSSATLHWLQAFLLQQASLGSRQRKTAETV